MATPDRREPLLFMIGPRSSRKIFCAYCAILFAFYGCQEVTEVRGVDANTIRIGTWGPLTGPHAAWGDSLRGMKAYAEWINFQGGIHNRSLELYVKDDRFIPSRTIQAARTLVEKDRVFAVVGAIGTDTSRAGARVLREAKVPLFSPASAANWITETDADHVTTGYLSYRADGKALANLAVTELGHTRLAVLYQDDDLGNEGLRGIEQGGGHIVARESVLSSESDVSKAARRLLEAKPEAILIYTSPRQAILLGQFLASRATHPQLLTGFVLHDPRILQSAGDVWEGTITSAVSKRPDHLEDPSVKQFRTVLSQHAPNLHPNAIALLGISLMQPFTEALFRAGPNLDEARLQQSLSSLQDYRGGGPYWEGDGLGAPVDFSKGQRIGVRSVRFARAEQGAWVPFKDWSELR